ncbi:MAG: transketolase family protein [Actinomycetaceae bacterium]|nr:transketolase family protein [Actinomycetaceae bacterium]
MTITVSEDSQKVDNRKPFADELCALAREDDRVVAVCNDSVSSSGLLGFREEFPTRLFNVGIAEQDMVGIAAGLANEGFIPFVCAAGPFLSGRATEQIKADIAYSQHKVILCAMSPGMSYGELGPTHHSIEDISWMRTLPDLDIIVPADEGATRAAVRDVVSNPRPTYMRIGRYRVPDTGGTVLAWQRGRAAMLRDGDDVTIIAYGTTVSRALLSAQELEPEGVNARVLDFRFIAPLDTTAILDAARTTRGIVVVEEATDSGALGAAVAMTLGESTHRVPLRVLGVRGELPPTGSNDFLLDYFGISDIPGAVREVLSRE